MATTTPAQVPFEDISIVDNPEPLCPCVLVLDISQGMSGNPVAQLNAGLRLFQREFAGDALASKHVELADLHLARYLGSLRFEDAKVPNIGAARCVVVRPWGIDTATDIDDATVAEIPGFGRSLTDKLMVRRMMREKYFTPSTTVIVAPLDVQRINRYFAVRRSKLVKDLRERIAEVERAMEPYLAERARRWAEVEETYAAHC